ncbi:SRPBCC domain-containing protein [Streptomyces sp. NPDC050504]|uniref:SRPBCC domain-containing protein n=1 Tax=Streptomyces sp. NPDC050504 TaxID=3365618 RepID=UPI0037A51EA6
MTIPHGTSLSHGETHVLRFTLDLPHPVTEVWAAVATPAGLPRWLAAADELQPRIGGRVGLRWLNGDAQGDPTVATGEVSAWDPERVAEYTVTVHGRIRFHLESPSGTPTPRTTLRFTNEFVGPDAYRLDCLAGWHDHFELLTEALDLRPTDWPTWTPARWRTLREEYTHRPAPQV